MPNILKDGTQIDQTLLNAVSISSGTSITSSSVKVPALYTGRLKVLILANDAVNIVNPATGVLPYIDIIYSDKDDTTIYTYSKYVNIYKNSFTAGNIMAEFNIPYKILKEQANGDKVKYIKIKVNYGTSSSGNLNAYLLWI